MPNQSEKKTPCAEELIALFHLDAPVPIKRLFHLYAGRSTFAAWAKQGLRVHRVLGLGPCVIPGELRAFLLEKFNSYAPRIQ
jgi:hypothetical protein